MIELTIEELILWVIGVPLIFIGLMALVNMMKGLEEKRKSKNKLIRCRACGYVYQDASREKSPHCPDCGRSNDRGESKRLG